MEKNRVEWLDAAKCIGMYMIYLGHHAAAAGAIYNYIFSFHVPFFFILCGISERYNHRQGVAVMLKRTESLLIPFFFFGILNILFWSIRYDEFISYPYLFEVLFRGGIRNQITLGGGLWYLTCLYSVSLLYWCMKWLKTSGRLFIAFGLYLLANYGFASNPAVNPSMVWNIDSACYYLVYYCIGYAILPALNRMFYSSLWIKVPVFILSLWFSALLFLGRINFEAIAHVVPVMRDCILIGVTMIPCLFTLFIAFFCSKRFSFSQYGRNSLWFCGNEYLVSELIPVVLSALGIQLNLVSPIQIYFYAACKMYLVYHFLIPAERPFLNFAQSHFRNIFKMQF